MKQNLNKSHSQKFPDYLAAIASIKDRMKSAKNPLDLSYEHICDILKSMGEVPLGRHILETGGANGKWTDYMISFPWVQDCLAGRMLSMNRLEYFIIFEMPGVLAQRELFLHSQKIAQDCVGPGKTFASIPCGLMRDLLELDIDQEDRVLLVGIDIDPDSLAAAKQLAEAKGVDNVRFEQKDAWNLNIFSEFDFINSIGLNCYEPDRDRTVELYKQVYQALKPGGVFFTGVLTYPPGHDKPSDWNIEALPSYHAQMDQILTKDILDLQFQNYRTLDEIDLDFRKAGFANVKVVPDRYRIFPAVIARK